jgi:hypothetical protein
MTTAPARDRPVREQKEIVDLTCGERRNVAGRLRYELVGLPS